jgi:(S)-sulfolactate dehydrogenase
MAAIVICEFLDEDAVKGILAGHDVFYDKTLVDRRADLLTAIADARVLIVRNRTKVDADLLAHGPKLEAIGRLGVGLDNIDLAACKARGVAVYPATGANEVPVMEYVIASMLILLRGVYAASAAVVAGEWPRTGLMGGREAAGKRLGIVGFGAIGRRSAAVAAALGMEICAYDPHIAGDAAAWTQPWGKATPLALDALLAASDVVSLHVPLSDETRNLLDAKRIASMKRDAILINAARGGVLDEAAVVAAVKSGALGGAALDVFAQEPLDKERAQAFAGCPNLILTPHVAGLTVESHERISRIVAEKVRDHLARKR